LTGSSANWRKITERVTVTFRHLDPLLRAGTSCLVLSHLDPDGDSIGSQLALAAFLKQRQATVVVANPDPVPQRYCFLPNRQRIQSDVPEGDFGVVFVLDAADLSRLGPLRERIPSEATLVNIDHHADNDGFGRLVYVNPRASSTAELVFSILDELGGVVTPEIACCIYTGIMMDTVRFRTALTSPRVFEICGRLVQAGADPGAITGQIFDRDTAQSVRMRGEVLRGLEMSGDGRVASLILTQEMCRRTGGQMAESEGFVNEAMAIQGVVVGVFLRELEDGSVRVSLRSRKGLEVNGVARMFGGGGHPQAAGCVLQRPLPEVRRAITGEVLRLL
jgi:phosphoesterase RecJ-like protein